jgi:hypothetical protein
LNVAFDWVETAQQAHAALVDAGGDDPGVTLTHTAVAEYDKATSTTTPGAVTTTAGVGLVFDYEFRDSGASTHAGTLVRAGDRRLYLSPLDASLAAIRPPEHGDKCLGPDGLTYNVESVKTLSPAGVPLLYDLLLRR